MWWAERTQQGWCDHCLSPVLEFTTPDFQKSTSSGVSLVQATVLYPTLVWLGRSVGRKDGGVVWVGVVCVCFGVGWGVERWWGDR